MTSAPALVPRPLARARPLVEPALREAVDRLHPWLARIVGYSFGWCAADGSPSATPGGKGIRCALALLAAEAAGGAARDAVPAAVAVELVHGFSLVHDDIMDGDELRRSRPTVWKAYGTGPAVLAGDAMLTVAMATAARTGSRAALGELVGALDWLVRGQAEDLAFESRAFTGPDAVTVEEYLAMASGKTGALLGCAAAMGAALAGARGEAVTAYRDFGRHLGVAFQAIDDVLSVFGDPHRTGKPAGGDLTSGKKTLPVLEALAASTPASSRLARLLLERPLAEGQLTEAALLIDRAGGRRRTEAWAHIHHQRALHALHSAAPLPCPKADLTEVAAHLLHRTA
ncbi:polyprenyl synthetase family protein [Streptomyces pathocidini]|uniref:Polyprenyl synthetase family protein n=1 Tax=Streptomyces pathocidini TaxID=1650571 RepID=A0ABW7UKE7_9ACTN|nr:polyprenyl synthetase family protein [Streptomyces pathocidini]